MAHVIDTSVIVVSLTSLRSAIRTKNPLLARGRRRRRLAAIGVLPTPLLNLAVASIATIF